LKTSNIKTRAMNGWKRPSPLVLDDAGRKLQSSTFTGIVASTGSKAG
jgi:hypothetical protein